MGTDNWSTVGREYKNSLNFKRVSLCLPNTQDLDTAGVSVSNEEVLQSRRAKLSGILTRFLDPNSKLLENDIRGSREPDDGESIVIYPNMPTSEGNQLVLLDRNNNYKRGEYIPDRWVRGIIDLEIAKRLVKELTRKWGIIPYKFLFDRKLLPAILPNLLPHESLVVFSFLTANQIFKQSLILSVFKNFDSDVNPSDYRTRELVFTKYYIRTGRFTQEIVPINDGSPRVYYHDRGCIVDTSVIHNYLELKIPVWKREINVVLKTVLLRHAGLKVK